MTREQQIEEQARQCFKIGFAQDIFSMGALWADSTRTKFYVLLGQVETDNEEIKGLWLNICGKYFASREQAEKYAEDFPHAYRKGQYNIVEIEPYYSADDSGILQRLSTRPIE